MTTTTDATEEPRCLHHGRKQVYCPVTKTWSAKNVMKGCPCVHEAMVVNGMAVRVAFVTLPKPKKKAKAA